MAAPATLLAKSVFFFQLFNIQLNFSDRALFCKNITIYIQQYIAVSFAIAKLAFINTTLNFVSKSNHISPFWFDFGKK